MQKACTAFSQLSTNSPFQLYSKTLFSPSIQLRNKILRSITSRKNKTPSTPPSRRGKLLSTHLSTHPAKYKTRYPQIYARMSSTYPSAQQWNSSLPLSTHRPSGSEAILSILIANQVKNKISKNSCKNELRLLIHQAVINSSLNLPTQTAIQPWNSSIHSQPQPSIQQ